MIVNPVSLAVTAIGNVSELALPENKARLSGAVAQACGAAHPPASGVLPSGARNPGGLSARSVRQQMKTAAWTAAVAAVARAHAAHRLPGAQDGSDHIDVEHAAQARRAHLVDRLLQFGHLGLAHRLAVYGERVGVVDEPTQPAASQGALTYAQVGELARRQAAKLDELGIGVGDRVAIVTNAGGPGILCADAAIAPAPPEAD